MVKYFPVLEITWQHLTELYEEDEGKSAYLAMLPKSKYEHNIRLTSSEIRGDLAARVKLSRKLYMC